MNKSITLVLLIAVMLSGNETSFAQKNKPLFTAKLGIAPYTFRKHFPNGVAGTLDTIKMMGFTEIEGGGGRMSPEEYKKLCDERGLSIPSFGIGYDQIGRAHV